MNDTTAATDISSRPAQAGASDLAMLGLAQAAAAISRGEVTSEAYTSALLQQARTQTELNSFIRCTLTTPLSRSPVPRPR